MMKWHNIKPSFGAEPWWEKCFLMTSPSIHVFILSINRANAAWHNVVSAQKNNTIKFHAKWPSSFQNKSVLLSGHNDASSFQRWQHYAVHEEIIFFENLCISILDHRNWRGYNMLSYKLIIFFNVITGMLEFRFWSSFRIFWLFFCSSGDPIFRLLMSWGTHLFGHFGLFQTLFSQTISHPCDRDEIVLKPIVSKFKICLSLNLYA